MTTRVRQPKTPPRNGQGLMEGQFQVVDEGDPEIEDTMQGFEVPGSSSASIWLITPKPPEFPPNRPMWVGSLHPPFGPDDIRKLAGGGYYGVLFVDENNVRVGYRRILIAGEPNWKTEQQQARQVRPHEMQPAPQQVSDPMLAVVLAKLGDLTDAIRSMNHGSSLQERLSEITVLVGAMRELMGPQKLEPELMQKWVERGVAIGEKLRVREIDEDDDGPPKWLQSLLQHGLPLLVSPEARRAAMAQRGLSSTREVVASPPASEPDTAAPNQIQVPERDPNQTGSPLPGWVREFAKEIASQISDDDNDMPYMVGWIDRHVPQAQLDLWEKMQPDQLRTELLQLRPLVAQAGENLTEEYATALVREFLMSDKEPPFAKVIDEPKSGTDG